MVAASPRTVLLTGATGMLGSAFAEALETVVVTAGRAELDVRDPAAIPALIERLAPDVVINCAADVNADKAEGDPSTAIVANVLLPSLLAVGSRRAGVPLVHFSSTGCYGDWKTEPYVEEDALRPTTVHHRAKVSGEAAVRDSGCEHLILRTGWLFGGGPGHARNFVWRRMLEASANPAILSDTGQRGNPTYVGDVVNQTLALMRVGLRGTYNCVSQGQASRFAYVERIIRAAGLNCRLEQTGPFRRRAPVSPNETALNQRLALLGQDIMPEWTQSLDAYMQTVRAWPEWAAREETIRG